MRIHNVGALVGNGGDILSDYDYHDLKGYELEEVWYHYHSEPYEGWGNLLAIDKTGNYYLHSLSHCSCNGPLEGFSLKDPFKTIDEIRTRCSQGYGEEIEPLLQAATVSLMGHS